MSEQPIGGAYQFRLPENLRVVPYANWHNIYFITNHPYELFIEFVLIQADDPKPLVVSRAALSIEEAEVFSEELALKVAEIKRFRREALAARDAASGESNKSGQK